MSSVAAIDPATAIRLVNTKLTMNVSTLPVSRQLAVALGAAHIPRTFQHADAQQEIEHLFSQPLGRTGIAHEMQIGMLWHLVSLIDARKILDCTGKGPAIEPFRVALHTCLKRRVDEDLDELALGQQLTHHPALRAKRRDE